MRALLALLLFLSPGANAAPKLADGICPFDEAKLAANFTAALRRDYSDKYIAHSFRRRESWYGPCKAAVAHGKNRFTLQYGEAAIEFEVTFSGGKIEQYGFQKISMEGDSWQKFLKFLAEKWPKSALYVVDEKGGKQAYREEEDLFIGEGRVLPLLIALENMITAGELKNEQKIKLLNADKAQDLDELASRKEGYALPLSEVKDRILSDLDRTASDIALRLVGPSALEEEKDALFLSRREASWLMTLSPQEMAKLERSQARATAAKLDRPGKVPPMSEERYDHLDKIGWRASAKELCESLSALSSVPELKNGLGSRGFRTVHPEWKEATYYAARDFGVAQTAWKAVLPGRKAATCFSLILNAGEALDEGEAEEVHARAVSLLIQP